MSDARFRLNVVPAKTGLGLFMKFWKLGNAINMALTLSEVPLVIAARRILSTLLPQISFKVG